MGVKNLMIDPIASNEKKILIKSKNNCMSKFYKNKWGLFKCSSSTSKKKNRQGPWESGLHFSPLLLMIQVFKVGAPWPIDNVITIFLSGTNLKGKTKNNKTKAHLF